MGRNPYRYDRFGSLFSDRLIGNGPPGRLPMESPLIRFRRLGEVLAPVVAGVALAVGFLLLTFLVFLL